MAIRFVDVELGEAGRGTAVRAMTARPNPDLRKGEAPAGDLAVKLPLAKPEPKPRGRKKPLR